MMKMRVRTSCPDAGNLVEAVLEVSSLREAKARFRNLQGALPHLGLCAHVARRRQEKHGLGHRHVIDRTNMH
ncbi:MAG: hypothetical protein OXH76_07875 [Boseongicola sp.]|nr:hypothetical protein [Boseongicola sp.]